MDQLLTPERIFVLQVIFIWVIAFSAFGLFYFKTANFWENLLNRLFNIPAEAEE